MRGAACPLDAVVTFEKCMNNVQGWHVVGGGKTSKGFLKELDYNVCLSAFDGEWAMGSSGQQHARSSIKHEFGHLIGLMHEQWNPNLKVTWDKDYVYAWCQKTQGWSKENCDRQVMTTLEQVNPTYWWKFTKFDKDSIMFYGIRDPNFTLERVTYPEPEKISEMDKQAVAEIYPGADPSRYEVVRCGSADTSCGGRAGPAPNLRWPPATRSRRPRRG